jgi:hypothetical protein
LAVVLVLYGWFCYLLLALGSTELGLSIGVDLESYRQAAGGPVAAGGC